MKLLLFRVFLAYLPFLAVVQSAYRIRNGQSFSSWTYNPYKYVVMLTGGYNICTGSIASSSLVFTAARCVCARGGDIEGSGTMFKVKVEDYKTNPLYKYCNPVVTLPSGYDIAVLFTNETIPISSSVTIGRFDFSIGPPVPGQQVVMIGFGNDKIGDHKRLRMGNGIVARDCNFPMFKDSPICVDSMDKKNWKSLSQGDMGGPLIDISRPSVVLGFATGFIPAVKYDSLTYNALSAYATVDKNLDFIRKYL